MGSVVRRQATPEETRALAHPLRLRILRHCLDEELTNKQLADRLAADPGTVIHHVRTLVATGFLVPGEVRAGARGALEKPYRATGKSWTVHVGEGAGASVALVDAFRAELAEAGDEALATLSRFAVTLGDEARDDFVNRLAALVNEFAERAPDPGGKPYGVLVAVHRRAWPAA